jgi:pyridinium-3,5-biscarboxylic acid mononucleotide sulfurtransferase
MITALRRWQPGAIAFSGGVDSTLLLRLAREAWDRPPLAVSFSSPLMTPEEEQRIRKLTARLQVPLKVLKGRPALDPAIRTNPADRCYLCKKNRFLQAQTLLERQGISFLLDGTNADDLNEYRPGLRANREARVISPFALLGWTKKDIRRAARKLGLPNWDQPSRACLATRVPYGQLLTGTLLKKIARGEAVLHDLGFRESRLRAHGPIARIEIPEKEFPHLMKKKNRESLIQTLTDVGFPYITLDLQGLRSGSLNAVLNLKRRKCGPV